MSSDLFDKPKSAVPFSVFLAVALLSAAVLGFEIALSRVFATVLRYQFAFLVVSLALCGLGLGGLWAHFRPKTSLENAALGWGIAVPIALALILRGVFQYSPQNYWIAALLVLAPFCFAGTFLSLAFGRFQEQGGRLYAFDLAGAALAALLSVALMQVVSAIHAALLFGVLGALAGVLMASKKAFSVIICLFLLLVVLVDKRRGLWIVPPIPPNYLTAPPQSVSGADVPKAANQPISDDDWQTAILNWVNDPRQRAVPEGYLPDANSIADRGITQSLFTEIGAQEEASRRLAALQKAGKADKKLKIPHTQIIDTRWNAFARTDVVKDPGAGDDALLVYTNGNVPTNMLRWDGKEWKLPALVATFPISDWTFGNANIKDANVFSIGPGGGLDALLAIRYGAKQFDGAEINPSIVGLMNERTPIDYFKYNGGIYKDPRVHVRTAEGRDAVRESKGHYRLVFSALTKTATAGQGAALLESFIYTREAFNDYLNAVDDEGSMAIVGDVPPLMARLAATAVDHFTRQGESQRDAGRHIAVVLDPLQRGPYLWSLVVKKTPFTDAQTLAMAQSAARARLLPLWIPGRASSDEFYSLGSMLSASYAFQSYIDDGRIISPNNPQSRDLSACPDDRPFVLDMGTSPVSLFQSSPSLTWMLGGALLATFALIAFLAFAPRREGGTRGDARGPLLFLLLGIGFMLVEVPLIQKLVLPLGYPTLSLSVILFSLLLGGGAGAFVSQRFAGDRLRRHALLCALGVVALTLVFSVSNDVVSRALLGLPIVPRCMMVAALLLPLGFLLGTPFPSGMRLLAPDARSVALAWALNGTASVVGSISAAVLAKMFGFSIVLAIGAVVYLCVAGVFTIKKLANPIDNFHKC
ncbi:hypothetical protein IAD21_02026 [Abditibacteriota bacterium]|nr:hypothetical protein IAD21_02026 [Abditibacteriota bacterium]